MVALVAGDTVLSSKVQINKLTDGTGAMQSPTFLLQLKFHLVLLSLTRILISLNHKINAATTDSHMQPV